MNPDSAAFDARLDDLSQLEDGWCNGECKAPTWRDIEYSRELLHRLHQQHAVPYPYIYPSINGGLFMEWDHGPVAILLEVSQDGLHYYMHAFNLETNEELADIVCEFFWEQLDDQGRKGLSGGYEFPELTRQLIGLFQSP